MQISQQLVASLHYTLKNDVGEVLDSSEGQEPMEYLHGAHNIVPGIEKALEGKSAGDTLSVIVKPEDGYGEYDDSLVQELPRDAFTGVETIEIGMEFQAETQQGMQVVEVIKVDDSLVTINGNHPLAGKNLHFDVKIVNIREATADELEHGHIADDHSH